jgi:Tfp pilus assembly protein FimT
MQMSYMDLNAYRPPMTVTLMEVTMMMVVVTMMMMVVVPSL